MRVLLLGDVHSVHTHRWVEALDGECDLLVAGFGEPTFQCEYAPLGSRRVHDVQLLAALPRLHQVIKSFRPQVLNAHFVASYGIVADLSTRRVPIVQTAWGSDILEAKPRWHNALIQRALERAAVVVHDAAPVAERILQIAPRTRVVAAYFGPEKAWCETPRCEARRILSPRQLRPLYNIRTVVGAFRELTKTIYGWTLDILTGGSDSREYLQHADDLPNGNRILMWPHIDRLQLQQRFLEASIFCSVPNSDGTSVALLEGMASGSFPIASDLPANRAWICDGENGLLVPAGDQRRLEVALRRAMADEDLRLAAREINRPLIAERASWERAVTSVLGEYRRVARA
jgi:L-malate glycosyltransferase